MGVRMKRFIGSTANTYSSNAGPEKTSPANIDSDWTHIPSNKEKEEKAEMLAQTTRIQALETELRAKNKKIITLSKQNQTLSTQNQALEAVIQSFRRNPIRKNFFEQVSDLFYESSDDEGFDTPHHK